MASAVTATSLILQPNLSAWALGVEHRVVRIPGLLLLLDGLSPSTPIRMILPTLCLRPPLSLRPGGLKSGKEKGGRVLLPSAPFRGGAFKGAPGSPRVGHDTRLS